MAPVRSDSLVAVDMYARLSVLIDVDMPKTNLANSRTYLRCGVGNSSTTLYSPLPNTNKAVSITNGTRIDDNLFCSLALFSIASGIYACLELFPTDQKYWMLYSRFLIGVSSSSVAVCRSYLSAATKVKERTGAVSMVSLAQTLGFIVGPVLQGAVTMFGECLCCCTTVIQRFDVRSVIRYVCLFRHSRMLKMVAKMFVEFYRVRREQLFAFLLSCFQSPFSHRNPPIRKKVFI